MFNEPAILNIKQKHHHEPHRRVEALYKESMAPEKVVEEFRKTLTQQRAQFLYKGKNP